MHNTLQAIEIRGDTDRSEFGLIRPEVGVGHDRAAGSNNTLRRNIGIVVLKRSSRAFTLSFASSRFRIPSISRRLRSIRQRVHPPAGIPSVLNRWTRTPLRGAGSARIFGKVTAITMGLHRRASF